MLQAGCDPGLLTKVLEPRGAHNSLLAGFPSLFTCESPLFRPQLFPSSLLQIPHFQCHTVRAYILLSAFYSAAWNPRSRKVTLKCSVAFWISQG